MANTDVPLIRSWWTLVPFNIATKLTGVVVVDVDADDALSTLAPYGPWPVTPTQRSGRGWHLFFRTPAAGLPTLSHIDQQPVETKGEGGSITLAPSRHVTGHRYTWVHDPFTTPLAEVPPRFLQHVHMIDAKRQARRPRTLVNPQDPHAVAALIRDRSARSVSTSNGLSRGAYGLRQTLSEAGADAEKIAAAERAWWRYHGKDAA